ncbi:MAG: hypothetical protein ACLQBA_17680 [Candidatus Binataceae bacterium]
MIRLRKAWLLGTLALAGCGLSAAAIGGLVGGVTTVVGTAATVYVESKPSATSTPSPTPSVAASATVAASPAPSVVATPAGSASATPSVVVTPTASATSSASATPTPVTQ